MGSESIESPEVINVEGLAEDELPVGFYVSLEDPRPDGPNANCRTPVLFLPLERLAALFPAPTTFGFAATGAREDLVLGAIEDEFRLPHPLNLTSVRASLGIPPDGSAVVIDVQADGVSILSTPITIDPGTESSLVAAAQPELADTPTILADDTEITVVVTGIGALVPGAGLKVWLGGFRVTA